LSDSFPPAASIHFTNQKANIVRGGSAPIISGEQKKKTMLIMDIIEGLLRGKRATNNNNIPDQLKSHSSSY